MVKVHRLRPASVLFRDLLRAATTQIVSLHTWDTIPAMARMDASASRRRPDQQPALGREAYACCLETARWATFDQQLYITSLPGKTYGLMVHAAPRDPPALLRDVRETTQLA